MRSRLVAVVALAAVAIGVGAWWRCRDGAESRDDAAEPAPVARGRARIAELRRQLPGSIAGVVTAEGAAVAGATACARPTRDAEPPRCTTTDARGTYSLDELAPGAYLVWASAPGRGGGRRVDDVRVATDRRTAGVDIVLAGATAEVRGIVRDVRGAPIAGAIVHVGPDSRAPPAFTTGTAADGAFVAWATPGDIYAAVSADRFVDGDARGLAPTATPLVIELLPESTIAGVVIEAGTRRPLDDATVSIGGTTARTDVAGRFRLAKLSPGRYKPTASAIGGYGETAESVLVGLGRSVDGLVIEIHPVAVVAGKLLVDDGTPCPPDRGEVSLSRYGSRAGYFARTGDAGDILLEGVVPGSYEVTAMCRGYLSRVPYPDLVVADSDVDDVVWRVAPGAKIAGRVRARTGAPIAGAVINHRAASGASWGSVATGADGTFTADGVAPGVNELDVWASGYPRIDTRPTIIAAFDRIASVDVVLDAGGAITGEAVDDSGVPIAVNVEARGPGGGSAWSDAAGKFTIDALVPGTYEVAVVTDWGRGKPVEVAVAIGATARVRVVAETLTGGITGIVVDGAGAAIGDAYVSVAREDESADPEVPAHRARGSWQRPGVLAALDGSFAIGKLPRGRYAVRASRDGGATVTLEHVATGGRARLVMPATGVLAGVVVPSTGAPQSIDDVTVSVNDRAREVSREERLFHTGGRFALRDLPAGTYQVSVDDDPRSLITVTLAEGERREDLRLVAQPRFTIRGRLVSATGAPLVGWTVEAPRLERDDAQPTGGRIVVSSLENAITGPDGRFLIRNLPAGPVTLSAANLAQDPNAKLAPIREVVLQGSTAVDLGDVAVR